MGDTQACITASHVRTPFPGGPLSTTTVAVGAGTERLNDQTPPRGEVRYGFMWELSVRLQLCRRPISDVTCRRVDMSCTRTIELE